MPLPRTRVFLALMIYLLLPAQAQAESFTLIYDKTRQVLPLTAGATPTSAAQTAEQTITLYPDAYTNQSGQIESIYDFTKKEFTVVNHAAKTYTAYPLHSVAVQRLRERLHRLDMKISMYQQRAKDMQISTDVLMEDLDIDMMLGSRKSTRTADRITVQKKDNTTAFTNGNTTLALLQLSGDSIPPALQRSYAHFVVYELTVHPAIKDAISAESAPFQKLNFINRDMFKNILANYAWSLKSVAKGTADAPVIPPDYTLVYHQSADINQAFKEALTPKAFDGDAFEKKVQELVDRNRYLEAYLATELEMQTMSDKDAATNGPSFISGRNIVKHFEKAVYLAITQTPESRAELKQYKDILEKAKPRAGELGWMIDYYIAVHTRGFFEKQKHLTKADLEQITQANETILNTLKHAPRMKSVYQDAGDAHYAALGIPTAMLYWAHLANIAPDSDGAEKLAKLKADAEKDFPEYF